MDKKLTLIAMSGNDENTEQLRINLFAKSLISQYNDEWQLLFWDFSRTGHELGFPDNPNFTIIREYIPASKIFCGYTKNILATKVKTPYLCHINPDCIYDANFTKIVMNKLKVADTLVMCCKRNLPQKETMEVFSGNLSLVDARKFTELDGRIACGECQGMRTKTFISIGGYFDGIKKDGSMEMGERFREDTNLKNRHSNHTWIHEDTFLIHLWHPCRASKLTPN